MRILLTGSNGMVGRNIREHTGFNQFELMALTRKDADLTSYKEVDETIRQCKPDLIIHAAGKVGGIQANIQNPIDFFIENLDMGRNLVYAAYKNGVKNLLNLGSSCMYPRDAANPLREMDILNGHLEPTNEGYALAKIAVAKLCEYIHAENEDFHYKTIIPCNLYGRWDHFDPTTSHMIPSVIRKIHEAKMHGHPTIEVWGDGKARREFMYAGDLADFIYYVVEHFAKLENLTNVGLGYDYSIKEYYQVIADIIGYKGEFIYNLNKPVGMKQKVVNIDKQKKLGWQPRTTLHDGVKNTYKFYLSLGGQY